MTVKRMFAFVAFALIALLLAGQMPFAVQAQGGPYFSDPEATDDHCGYTDETTSGPYYISGVPEGENINYTNLPGEAMQISGMVYDGSTGQPVVGAKVTVWQVDSAGKYWPAAQGKAADFAPAQIALRGSVISNEKGEYTFTSIKPAIYEGRRRHVHYYIEAAGYISTFTQTYWADDTSTSDGVDANTEKCRVLAFKTENNLTSATFNIYLRPDPANPAPTKEAVAAPAFTLLNLNAATADQLLTIPAMSNRMVREFFEYRPYISISQFRREIGKYVNADQVAAYEKFVYVPVNVNSSDAATLQQIPGVDEKIAADLIAARPYADNAAFLAKLGTALSAEQTAYAANYLEVK